MKPWGVDVCRRCDGLESQAALDVREARAQACICQEPCGAWFCGAIDQLAFPPDGWTQADDAEPGS